MGATLFGEAPKKVRAAKKASQTTMTKSRAPGAQRAGTRRNRESIEDLPPLSPAELYEVQGDAVAAYKALTANQQQAPSLSTKYNLMILAHLAESSKEDAPPTNLLQDLEAWEQQWATHKSKTASSNKKRQQLQEWICAYNRGVTLLAYGKPLQAAELVSSQVASFVKNSHEELSNDLKEVATRMAFLILECVLSLSLARHTGLLSNVPTSATISSKSNSTETTTPPPLSVKQVVDWLESSHDMEQDPKNKFLVALYKSRLDFSARDDQGKLVEPKIRSAKKELKTAMEVFQQKLRPQAPGEAASVGSSSDVYSEESMSTNNAGQQHVQLSNVLKGHNQSALNLKANLEQLKANPKKSLILCGEARASHPDPSYEAIHANNLGIVYQTNGRPHLALHAATKALCSVSADTKLFREDGTIRQLSSLPILYNAALYALQSGNNNYMTAYEFMATCVREQPSVYGQRPRCWLRMAEACIGIHAGLRSEQMSKIRFATVEQNGEPTGLLLQLNGAEYVDKPLDDLASVLGSPEDIEQVRTLPLLRAQACLERSLKLLNDTEKDDDCMTAVQLALSYISLERREYDHALDLAKQVSESRATSTDDEAFLRVHKRRLAAARMYGCEAMCSLGDAMDGMRFLAGDGKNDAFDRLASDLAAATIKTAATNGKDKIRLAKAQSMVRSSASAASAVLGNLTVAKQLAMSAQAMEDACSSSRENSSARRALLYCMLREGNYEAALTLLRSAQ